ncbi:MAG: nucleotide exchange factor GrpE [Acidobacteria bacterium]|nr:MAG: nucleotide exchange factor GrpE [Acidobacteriota bacterium]
MNPEQEIESLESADERSEAENAVSVDDFIRELEAKEKDLHIDAQTTVIEIEDELEPNELPDFLKEEFPQAPAKESIAAAPAKEKTAQSRFEADNRSLKEKLVRVEDERDELLRNAQRRSKDLANYKTRVERERRETFQNQVTNIATQMLPALDNLNRAVDFAVSLPRHESSEFQQFFDGVVLVSQQVNEVLAGMGIEQIATIGEMFDPHLHEAAATEETEEFEPNTICGELLKGYRIGDRVVRHSVVRVAKAQPRSAEHVVLEKMFNDAEQSEESDALVDEQART